MTFSKSVVHIWIPTDIKRLWEIHSMESGPNMFTYQKPLIDPYYVPKLAFHANTMAFQRLWAARFSVMLRFRKEEAWSDWNLSVSVQSARVAVLSYISWRNANKFYRIRKGSLTLRDCLFLFILQLQCRQRGPNPDCQAYAEAQAFRMHLMYRWEFLLSLLFLDWTSWVPFPVSAADSLKYLSQCPYWRNRAHVCPWSLHRHRLLHQL